MNIDMLEKVQENRRTSSKGNQNKWRHENKWYKEDGLGYEALAEIVVSRLLEQTNVADFVAYEYVPIERENRTTNGCVCDDFLECEEERIISIERLFQSYIGVSVTKAVLQYESVKDRIKYVVDTVEKITGLKNFGIYMRKMITVDALFLNEDRHFHNIAVIQKSDGSYRECPIFDNGAALFSDFSSDYPLEYSAERCMEKVKAKPFSTDFDEQLDACELLYGGFVIKATFGLKDVENLLTEFEGIYDGGVLNRVREIMSMQIRKYAYLFSN